MNNKTITIIIVSLILLCCCCFSVAIAGYAAYNYAANNGNTIYLPTIVPSAYPIETPVISPFPTISSRRDCVVTGCSGQLCVSTDTYNKMGGGITTCVWKDEYACYAFALCEKQASGTCGWTATTEYNRCLADIGIPQN